jgi:RNA polymerase sigma-B factor
MADLVLTVHDPELLVLRYLESPREDLKDQIIKEYAGVVEYAARRLAKFEPKEDLSQVGYIGLIKALDRFDPKAGVKFKTYAAHLVAGEIRHYLRDRGHTIRQPSWLQDLRVKVTKMQALLQGQLMRPATLLEVAEKLDVSEQAVEQVVDANGTLNIWSLDVALSDEDGTTGVDMLDGGDFCPEQLRVEDRLVLEKAMSGLREIEKNVLTLFHFESLSQTEIAKRLGISSHHVSHVLRQSLYKLREVLAGEERKDKILRRQASTITFEVIDDETGAYTEEYFRNRLEEEVHRANSEEGAVAVLMVEFEGLEKMSRFYGGQSVADFMAEAAEFLQASFRRLDMVARFGKAGFAVILPSTGPSVSVPHQRLLEQAKKWAQDRAMWAGDISTSIGTACSPEDGKTVSDLLRKARPLVLKPISLQ